MKSCPYCGTETRQVNNHVRMKNDDQHGPSQTYPDDWDSESMSKVDSTTAEGSESSGSDVLKAQSGQGVYDDGQTTSNPEGSDSQTVHGLEDDPENVETGASELSLADSPADAREYDCGECGSDTPYLSDCPECGNSLKWTGVGA